MVNYQPFIQVNMRSRNVVAEWSKSVSNNSNKKLKGSLQSQIGKLLTIFKNGLYKSESNFKEELKEYLDHMSDKKGKEVWHKLNGFTFSCNTNEHKVEKISLQRILLDFVDNKPNSVFNIIDNLSKAVAIGDYKYPEDKNISVLSYNLKLNFFTSLFEYCIRMKEVGE